MRNPRQSRIFACFFALTLAAAVLGAPPPAAAQEPPDWTFRVEAPHDLWSEGGAWAIGTQIEISVDDPLLGSGPEHLQFVLVDQVGPDPGDVGWRANTAPFVIEPGDVITINDGASDPALLTLVNLSIDSIDEALDRLAGTAPPDASVAVHAADGVGGVGFVVVADPMGNWVADFTGTHSFDIRLGTGGSVAVFDAEGDATHRNWELRLPEVNVSLSDDTIEGSWWDIGVAVTVEVDDPATASSPDWSDSTTPEASPWDPEMGYFHLRPGDDGFDLLPGHFVVVSNGVADKELALPDLAITDVDTGSDMVQGTATPSALVDVWVTGQSDNMRGVTAAPDGTWLADFSVPSGGFEARDLVEGDGIHATEFDDDGDTTAVSASVPNPQIGVETPNQIFSTGDGWIEGRTAWITVDDDHDLSNGTLFTATRSVESWGPEPWEVGWHVDTGGFEILPDYVVRVADTVDIVRTLDVIDLRVTDVDQASDTITGVALANAWVDGHAADDLTQAHRRVQAQADGSFTIDFGNPGAENWEESTVDIRPGVGGGVSVSEDDGDATHRAWRVAEPYIGVNVTHEELWAIDFDLGSTLSFTVEDPATLLSPDWEDTMVVVETEWGQTEAGYRFWGDFDIHERQVITVTDGVVTRTLDVSSLEVTNVDPETDRYQGTVATGHAYDSIAEVCAWARHPDLPRESVMSCAVPEAAGNWAIDFTGVGDVVAGDHSNAWQNDADGDVTEFAWSVPPWIYVELWDDNPNVSDLVHLEQWEFPATVTNGTNTVVVTDGDENGYGSVEFEVSFGDTVTVTGADGRVKAVEILPLAVTDVTAWNDVPPSSVFGTTDPAYVGNVQVTATANYGWWTERWVGTNDGTFVADFANPGNGWREQEIGDFDAGGSTDVYTGGEIRAHIWDDDNDQVQSTWHAENPRIIIVRGNDRIEAIDFPLGEPLTIEVDDLSTAGVEFTQTGVVGSSPDRPWETLLIFELGEYTVPDVATVTAFDGDHSPLVTTDVIAFTIDDVDPDLDTISGSAEAGSEVLVEADGNWRYPVADESNKWTADFSRPGSKVGEENPVDLQPGSSGRAVLLDENASATTVLWSLSAAGFGVDATGNNMWGDGFVPGASVNVTVNGLSWGDFSTDGSGHFDAGWDPAELDLGFGDSIVVSDGTTTKHHNVTALVATEVDLTAEAVSGLAAPGSDLDVWVHNSEAWRHVTANSMGVWTADFSVAGDESGEETTADLDVGSDGNSNQCDDDGDCTFAAWWVPNPSFFVDPTGNNMWGDGFVPGASVNVTVNGLSWGDFSTDGSGHFDAGWDPAELDLGFGDSIVVSDGTNTKEHMVLYIEIIEVSTGLDHVIGRTEAGVDVEVEVHDVPDWTWRHEIADGSGLFTGNFSTPGDEAGEEATAGLDTGSYGSVDRRDEDGDATRIHWDVPNPSFSVRVDEGEVHGYQWTMGQPVTLEIDDPDIGGVGVDYTETLTPQPAPWDPTMAWVQFAPGASLFELRAGQLVRMRDEDVTKTHVIAPLFVQDVDIEADTVVGASDPDVEIWVELYEAGFGLPVTTSADGRWIADFSGHFDIVAGTEGEVSQPDEDGDTTKQGWHARDGNAEPEIISFSGPDEPVAFGSDVVADGQFIDPDQAASHQVRLDWGDGTVTDHEPVYAGDVGSISASHLYAEPGIYLLTLTVVDDSGASAEQSFGHAVVYDPDGRKMQGTIRGTMDDTTLQLSVNVDLAKKSGEPEGRVRMIWDGSGFAEAFESSTISYALVFTDWGIIVGTGTMGDGPVYEFIVTLLDQSSDGGTDAFRVAIWGDEGEVVFDTQPGDDLAVQPLLIPTDGDIKVR